MEYQCSTAEELETLRRAACQRCREITVLYPAEFTQDPSEQALFWKIRKGTFTPVGGTRPLGTTVIIEDVTFPFARACRRCHRSAGGLSSATEYPDTIIFGHAKDGNLHFVLTPSFEEASRSSAMRPSSMMWSNWWSSTTMAR